MPRFFSRSSGVHPVGGRWGHGFFALHLTLGGKVNICGRDDLFFCFCSSLDFGRKTDVMTFKKPVLLLRRENISSPAGMALNCAPTPFQIPGHAPVGQCPGS